MAVGVLELTLARLGPSDLLMNVENTRSYICIR